MTRDAPSKHGTRSCGQSALRHGVDVRGPLRRTVHPVRRLAIQGEYAAAMRYRLDVPADKIAFNQTTVYGNGEPDGSFDFAIQSGVFHHLEDEDLAYREVFPVFRRGGSFRVYTDGENANSHHMWAPVTTWVTDSTRSVGIRISMTSSVGFGAIGFETVRHLTGGLDSDFDPDVVGADKWGRARLGFSSGRSGDILAALMC